MQNLFKLLFWFYRPVFLWNFLFALAGYIGISQFGAGFIGVFFLIKLLGYASSIFFQHYFSNRNDYYYYRNNGFEIRKMYLYAFLIDFFIYTLLLVLYLLLKPH